MKDILKDRKVASAKPQKKKYKLVDGEGLYLLVLPSGNKSFKYDYRLRGIRGTFTIGRYPDVSLADARVIHRQARSHVAQGKKPIHSKQETVRLFSYYFKIMLIRKKRKESTLKELNRMLKTDLQELDDKDVAEWTSVELTKILMKKASTAPNTALRLLQIIRSVYEIINAQDIMNNNPTDNLEKVLPEMPKAKSLGNTGDPVELAVLLKEIYKLSGNDIAVRTALKLVPHLFLRPANVRLMKWEFIDFDNALMTIPASNMKMDKELKVPLSWQALDLIKSMEEHTGHLEYVFSTKRGNGTPLGDATLSRTLGLITNPSTGKQYGKSVTAHGFRHVASTILGGMVVNTSDGVLIKKYEADAIELQMAHLSKDIVKRTYNKAELLPLRIRMMQEWSDYLDGLRAENVIQINRKKG